MHLRSMPDTWNLTKNRLQRTEVREPTRVDVERATETTEPCRPRLELLQSAEQLVDAYIAGKTIADRMALWAMMGELENDESDTAYIRGVA